MTESNCPRCGTPALLKMSGAGREISAYYGCGTGRYSGAAQTPSCRQFAEYRRRVEDLEQRAAALEQLSAKFADGQAVTWRGREACVLRQSQPLYEITFVDELGRRSATVVPEEQLSPRAVVPAPLTVGEPVEVVYNPKIYGIIDVIRGKRALVYTMDRSWAEHDINNLRRTSQDVSSLLK